MKTQAPLVLLILDGWGISKEKRGNAILTAKTPNLNYIYKNYPNTQLVASGESVGLPKNNQGNSEVGHLNIGAGRIIYQNLVRINRSIDDNSFFKNNAFVGAINNCKKNHTSLHLMGLLQDQGVHGHEQHLYALLKLCKKMNFHDVWIHIFSDGRDTLPMSAKVYISRLEKVIKKEKIGKIATVTGRYYAMDRDKRWDRIKIAYDALTLGKGKVVSSAKAAIDDAYSNNETDEFIKPRIIKDYSGIKENDGIILFNFRYDRARQITRAFTEKKFDGFKRKQIKTYYIAMAQYYQNMNAKIAFPELDVKNNLGEVLSKHKIKQLRIAETEKYAHVTFYFNSLKEIPNKGEDRILIPSNRKVPTYDFSPEMGVYKITKTLLNDLEKNKHSVYIVNFANGDMVGHTGKLNAAIKAVECVDECIGKVFDEVKKQNGTLLITADHGNCEKMLEKDGSPNTAHTINNVPFILISPNGKTPKLRKGILSDVAPTMLELLKIKKPKEMDCKSLIVK